MAPPAQAPASPPCELLNETSVALEIVEAGDATSTLAPGARKPIAPGPFSAHGGATFAYSTVFAYCFPGENITVGGPGNAHHTVAKAARPGECRVRNDSERDLVLRRPNGVKLGELRREDSSSKEAVLAAGEITVETRAGLAVARCASGTLRVVTERHEEVEALRFSLNDGPPSRARAGSRGVATLLSPMRAPSSSPQPGSFWLAWDGGKIAGHVARGSAVVVGKVALPVAPDGTVSGTLPNNLDLLLDAPVPEGFPNYELRVTLPVRITAGARVVKAEASLPVSEAESSVMSSLGGIAAGPIPWATPADPKRPRPTILVRSGAGYNGTKLYGCFRKLRDLELVAVRTDVTLKTESCGPYRAPGAEEDRWVERREQIASVTVYEARTGRQLAKRTFPKSEPPGCKSWELFHRTELKQIDTGGEPDEGAIAGWLAEQ